MMILMMKKLNIVKTLSKVMHYFLNKDLNSPEFVAATAVVMYLELGRCLLLLSNQLRTSRTACGFFFCSVLLMLLFISRFIHCSGKPCIDKICECFNVKNYEQTTYSKLPSDSVKAHMNCMFKICRI